MPCADTSWFENLAQLNVKLNDLVRILADIITVVDDDVK